MQRFERRRRILRGKRDGAFDPGQYYLEESVRGRTARKVRSLLRTRVPVVLYTPRWSQPQRFLEDIAVDLSVGRPNLVGRTLSMVPTQGRGLHESRSWILRGVQEFCELELSGNVTQAVDHNGFRFMLGELFERAARSTVPRVLLLHGLEQLNVEVRSDLAEIFVQRVMQGPTGCTQLNFLFAGALDVTQFTVDGARHLQLFDYGTEEAVEALMEWVGPTDRQRLWNAIEYIGGVPALVDALGSAAERDGRLANSQEELWRALGSLADELRGAVSIVVSDEVLAERLEQVAHSGVAPEDPRADLSLRRAGLFQRVPWGQSRVVHLRAPVLGELAFSA